MLRLLCRLSDSRSSLLYFLCSPSQLPNLSLTCVSTWSILFFFSTFFFYSQVLQNLFFILVLTKKRKKRSERFVVNQTFSSLHRSRICVIALWCFHPVIANQQRQAVLTKSCTHITTPPALCFGTVAYHNPLFNCLFFTTTTLTSFFF